jgi:hypothetical protein
MNLQNRIDLLVKLAEYIQQNDKEWIAIKKEAEAKNPWFIENFTDKALSNICNNFLEAKQLEAWIKHYCLDDNIKPKNVGIVMAGNIPLVGFHDFLSVFVSGHRQTIKLSSKDDVLLRHLIQQMYVFDKRSIEQISIAENLRGCDAYIATGSNQSSGYFKQYFSSYPHIIRNNKTSVAILSGNETTEELERLAEDIHLYFGLGCRNVTKLYVPKNYDFTPVLKAFDTFSFLKQNRKYSNNYDYQLSILLLNKYPYMTNEVTLLIEHEQIFSSIGMVHYEYYDSEKKLTDDLKNNSDIQCIVGQKFIPFGKGQSPRLFDYADGVDTMQFLLTL